jgi:shikimate kinase
MQSDSGMVDDRKNDKTLIFLVGFMGAGKTTVGKVLAQVLGFRFLDLDEVIEERAGRKVREIFDEFGEPRFRELEREAILSCVNLTNTIIALGGGAYFSEANRLVVSTIGKTIWLNCPLAICLARIEADDSRPLASTEENMRALYQLRVASYNEADLKVQITQEQSPLQIAEGVIKMLGIERARD